MIKRLLAWLDDRSGLLTAARRALEHPVPPRTGWWYVFGSATFIAFVLQVADRHRARHRVRALERPGLRQPPVHLRAGAAGPLPPRACTTSARRRWCCSSASTSRAPTSWRAYKFPRELNWLTGAVLLLLTLALAFTGQLLRWDQNAVWSVIVGAAQAGAHAGDRAATSRASSWRATPSAAPR